MRLLQQEIEIENLSKNGLELTPGAVVTVEALADTAGVVAQTSAGAVSAGLVTEPLHHIRTGGALNERAIRSTTTQITNTSHVLLGIPGLIVVTAGFFCELRFGEAHTRVATSVGADGTLAGNTFVVIVASTLASLSIAAPLVGALDYGVSVVGVHYVSNPSLGLRACSSRAIRASPCGLPVHSVVASTLVVVSTASVSITSVGAVSNCTSQNEGNN